ncbi:MAG: GNAT family N-acetyltransferase [Syntrophaceae bacterium]|nr:GNAT family N-acetyltransferase [Syntrophaceae bacterium]
MGLTIRSWQKSDLAPIRRIIWQSWMSTYSSFISKTDLKTHFDTYYSEASLLRMFDNSAIQGFVAATEDNIAGFARLFYNRDENRLYITSMYFLPECQGQGMGRKLLEAAEKYAVKKSFDELWLGVMVKNRVALNFYRKAGFLFVREEPFTMGDTTVSHLIGYKKLGGLSLLSLKSFATFNGGKNLSKLCLKLLSEQKKTWQNLREGYELLKEVRERDLSCGKFNVRLQYNPGRIKSSTALVKKKNQKGPPCFLCLDHLPKDQKGISYRKDYLILCNPMPVFSTHFTISHLDHRLQAIAEHIDAFLQLMADFGSGWIVLYNGPKCGASAPNHLHFQAAPSGRMPIEKELREKKRLALTTEIEGVLIYQIRDLGREVIVLEGGDSKAVGCVFSDFLSALKKARAYHEEPMVNIAGLHEKRKWRLMIFPRQKHRPNAFFREGDARMVVSPGVIDMGGLLITPRKKDFKRMNQTIIKGIFKEVSLQRKIVERAMEVMK